MGKHLRSVPNGERESAADLPSNDDRLDSWKEIAAYLNRTVRTVQRWERTRGLPVYRVPGGSRGSVNALKSEIDAWYRSISGAGQTGEAANGEEQLRKETGRAAIFPSARETLWPWLAAAVGALVVVVFVWVNWGQAPQGPRDEQTEKPFTSLPGEEHSPSFNPDGDWVVFSWTPPDQDNSDIYLKKVGTAEPIPRTTDEAFDVCPTWSPNGKWIAFLRLEGTPYQGSQQARVMVLPEYGDHERELTTIETSVGGALRSIACPLAWSPDSQWLVSVEREGQYLISAETGVKRRLIEAAQLRHVIDPAFSPDGTRIAYGGDGLRVLKLSESFEVEGEIQDLSPRDLKMSALRTPVWAQDGESILYSWGGELRRVFLSDPERVESLRIWGQNRYLSRPAFAYSEPTGRLVFEEYRRDTDIVRIERIGPQQYGPPEPLIASTQLEWNPQYSPDGNQILITSLRSGELELHLYDSSGEYVRQLTELEGRMGGSAVWAPDGQSIAYFSTFEPRFSRPLPPRTNIYIVPTKGGVPSTITDGQSMTIPSAWSRDGEYLYASSNRVDGNKLWKFPVSGGDPELFVDTGAQALGESADGFLYYLAGPGVLRRSIIDGCPERRCQEMVLARKQFGSGLQYADVHLAEDGIYLLSGDPSLSFGYLQFFSFASRELSLLRKVDRGRAPGISVSPDGRYIIYSQQTMPDNRDLRLVENFQLE